MEMFNGSNVISEESNLNNTLIKTFFRMFLGVFATAIIALFTYTSGLYLETISFYPILAIAEVAVVLIFSLCFRKLPAAVVTILYFVYAIINGFTLSSIFAIYDMTSISYAFFGCSGLFGALALYGYTTKKDISKFGTICMFGLGIGLIVSIVNLFIGSTMIDLALDWIILAFFCGITMYDMQKVKNASEYLGAEREKMYVYFAMDLYLDFINMFLRILSLFAKRRD